MSEEVEKLLRMLQVHNAKTEKIRHGYVTYCGIRQQALQEGITYEEAQLKYHQSTATDGVPDEGAKKVKSARVGVAKKTSTNQLSLAKKKFAAKQKEIDVTIKVKDEEGKIVEFETDEVVVAAPAKKKKKVAKTVRADMQAVAVGAASIDAEDTLAMIKNALKSNKGKLADEIIGADLEPVAKKKKTTTTKKKVVDKMPKLEEQSEPLGDEETKEESLDFQEMGDLEATGAANKKAGGKKVVKKGTKKGKKKKEAPNSITRFFNDYGESPHLQAIEMSYLLYLEAQHAKESHLKAVKKM